MPITAKIDVTKIDKNRLFKGRKGIYLDLVIFPLKNGEDEFGNTHVIAQGVSKEDREAGEKGAILGNLRMPVERQEPARRSSAPARKPAPPADPDLDAEKEDLPF